MGRLFGRRWPLPLVLVLVLVLGQAYVEERPDGADNFTMRMNLAHPLLGEPGE